MTRTEKIDKANALLEGGQTLRLHTLPHLQHYDVAQHSWNMAALLHVLWPDCRKELLLAILFHDCAERWVGDTPAPAKWWIAPTLGTILAQAEARILTTLGAAFPLNEYETAWLKALDVAELYLFCCSEVAMGNTLVMDCRAVCHNILTEDWVPTPVRGWIEKRPLIRTTDTLGKEE